MNNNSMNLNNQSMENIKNLVDNGNISEAISQISPEMIQNFSKILSSQKKEKLIYFSLFFLRSHKHLLY